MANLWQEVETREPIAQASSFYRARDVAQQIGFKPRKQLGQNFVIDPNTIDRIVRLSDIEPGEVVLEVGPGLGALTQALVQVAKSVIAVEIDDVLANRLPTVLVEQAQAKPGGLESLTEFTPWQVINRDILQMDTEEFPPADVVVANLPYNVATPVVLHLFEKLPDLKRMLVMVQAEVAERWCAPVGTKIYGVPTVKLEWFADCKVVGHVDRSVFWPRPHVDSSLVELVRKPTLATDLPRERVFKLIDAAFSQRRKTLVNSLTSRGYLREAVSHALVAMGLPEKVRGERLTCEQYISLGESLAAFTK